MSFTPKNPVVWAEIPVRDIELGVAFYSKVFDYEMKIDTSGPNPIAFFPAENFDTGVAGHLYPGKPAADNSGPTVHFAVPDSLEATKARLVAAGGKATDLVVEIPGGKFLYATDPDGNSIGLFEAKG